MEKLKIPTTKYVVFTDRELALKFVSGIEKFPVTIKIDSIPKNTLGRQMFKKLKVYAGPEHNHEAHLGSNGR